MSFLNVNLNWINLATLTRVSIVRHRGAPDTLEIFLADRQAPVDVSDSIEVAKVLAFCQRHDAEANSEVPIDHRMPEQKTPHGTKQQDKQQTAKV